MTKFTLNEQEELFKKDFKLINLRYEYHGYTGQEKWAVVTELAEEELRKKYPDAVRKYAPYVLLSTAQGEVISNEQNYEAKIRMRNLRFRHAFDINNEAFEEHHPELVEEIDYVEKIELKENIKKLNYAIAKLNQNQKKRIKDYYFRNKTYEQIAEEEGVTKQSVRESINGAVKKIKKFF